MRYRFVSLFSVAVVAVLYLLNAPPAPASGQQNKTTIVWQYAEVDEVAMKGYAATGSVRDGLNYLGSGGWELVTVSGGQPYVEAGQKVQYSKRIFYLKKQK